MNKVILMGRLTRDPDIRYTTGDTPTCIARFTLAVDRRKPQEADYINCAMFGRRGEFAEKYLRKGTKILITGEIRTGSYTNREGRKIYTTEVVAEECEFAESKNAQRGDRQQDGQQDDFMDIPPGVQDEIPFN